MAAAVPKLLPMEDTLITRKDMWKRRLEFVIKMTSGVVYSIMMHSVIITAYALLIFRIFYINGFDLDQLNDVSAPIMFSYLPCGVLEVAAILLNITFSNIQGNRS
ncbi:uncharacterized protein LOC110225261 [Arabidopsis lyrata subsp. lyrata]|uniref:uncharacterized protein LOC110225261 n=1 Tax=Arabidopsis lyrata subsp. lyrata TaxID=81972 RepID=UPI000A29BB66|nr:uncharacterized protein LOC110225261 [Arabidopsis lyrata subsp. lyrata]|eukprot:XP_020870210.1 uncharacterized protein LOC110225261 [Arabidopsis lyrata subsp. lyrata]